MNHKLILVRIPSGATLGLSKEHKGRLSGVYHTRVCEEPRYSVLAYDRTTVKP